jgi:uncharacterized membrane protein
MIFLINKKFLTGIFITLSVLYPFFVYYFLDIVPALYFILGIIGLLSIRIALLYLKNKKSLAPIFFSLFVVAVMLIFYCWNSSTAPLFYPVVMSLAIAFLMGFTLLYPPSMIERFARLLEPDLDERGVRYTRKVTVVWMMFGFVNAALSLITVILNDRAIWTLYNGCISYILMGLLMSIEYIVRRYHKARIPRKA